MSKNIFSNKKTVLFIVSLFLIIFISIGVTAAFLEADSDPVVNTFQPGKVTTEVEETFEKNQKTEVSIKNTGTIPAYIRAYININWIDEDGNIAGQAPIAGVDYNLVVKTNLTDNWFKEGDYYYYKYSVAAGDKTTVLIETAELLIPKDGYKLSVEILGSGIQSIGSETDKPADEARQAIETAWPSVKVNSDGHLERSGD